MDEAGRLQLRLGLCHGDLSPTNLRVDALGRPVLLDWGSATTGPVPYQDLYHLSECARTTGEPDRRALEALLAGWSEPVPPRAVSLITLLSALDLVRWALAHAPDRIAQQAAAAHLHVRRMLAPRGTVR